MGNREFSDRSHRVFATRRTVRFREMEYAVPAESVPDALRDVMRLIDDRGWRISFPVEVRFARSDDLWMSTAYGRESGYIAVHRYYREDPTEYFSAVEEIMLGYGGRPHWGKMHTRDSTRCRDMYPRYDDFLAVRDRLDPAARLREPLPESSTRRMTSRATRFPSAETLAAELPRDFVLGVATSAFQIEGATREGGRGASTWDAFMHQPGRIRGGATADVATDHIHRLDEDVDLVRDLGVDSYRFSISWPRVQPGGSGR